MAVADFGPLVVETDLDAAIQATLEMWLPHYLSQIEDERDLAIGTLQRPRPESYAIQLEDQGFPDQALPALLVTTGQMEGDAERDGDGLYSLSHRVQVSSVVRGSDWDQARFYASLFGGCVLRCLLQQATMSPLIARIFPARPSGLVRIDQQVSGTDRYLTAAVKSFLIDTDNFVQDGTGPLTPDPYYPDPDPTDPGETYDPPAVVTSVVTTVEGLPITDLPGE
jgi:hypothetical protein